MASTPDAAGGATGPEGPEDTGLELSAELQQEIVSFASGLASMSYYEILGVSAEADEAELRAAFFERSKRFHPDRYFQKKIGAFEPLLHELYKRIVAAHEVLRTSELREGYDRMLGSRKRQPSSSSSGSRPVPAKAPAPGDPAPRSAPERPIGSSSPGSLRARRGLRPRTLISHPLSGRGEPEPSVASAHARQAARLRDSGDLAGAVAELRHAIATDPAASEYHDALADVLPEAHVEAAERALREAETELTAGHTAQGLRLMEEAAQLRPTDADLHHRVAAMLLESPEHCARAIGYAARAAELEHENAVYQRTLGVAHRQGGSEEEARRALQRAVELDPGDQQAKQELEAL